MARGRARNGRSTGRGTDSEARRSPPTGSISGGAGADRPEAAFSPSKATMRTLPTPPQRASQRLSEPRARAATTTPTCPRREGGASLASGTAVASETQMHFAKVRARSNAGGAPPRERRARFSFPRYSRPRGARSRETRPARAQEVLGRSRVPGEARAPLCRDARPTRAGVRRPGCASRPQAPRPARLRRRHRRASLTLSSTTRLERRIEGCICVSSSIGRSLRALCNSVTM